MSDWCEKSPGGSILRVQAQPRASRTEISGPIETPQGWRLKIRLAAPPVDGEANEELLRFLKKKLGITQSSLSILRGDASKLKDVQCDGITPEELRSKLAF